MNWVMVVLVAAALGALARIYFNIRRIRRDRPDDWDARMVERVRSQGVDPFKPIEVDFFFALPGVAACEAARGQLESQEFRVDIREVPDSTEHPFSLHASKALRLSVPGMQENSRRFRELAQSLGGRYDGWAAGSS